MTVQQKGRLRLFELHDQAQLCLDQFSSLLTRRASRTNKFLVRGAIMEMEAATYRLELAAEKLRDALTEDDATV